MVEACERRILEFPLGMDAREIAKELKREGWYAWASDYESIISRIKRVRGKSGKLRNAYGLISSIIRIQVYWCILPLEPAAGWCERAGASACHVFPRYAGGFCSRPR